MKAYEKPRLIALSLQGNERLCGDCATAGKLTAADLQPSIIALFDTVYGNSDGVLSREEFAKIFATGEGCSIEYNSYCNFTYSESAPQNAFP